MKKLETERMLFYLKFLMHNYVLVLNSMFALCCRRNIFEIFTDDTFTLYQGNKNNYKNLDE